MKRFYSAALALLLAAALTACGSQDASSDSDGRPSEADISPAVSEEIPPSEEAAPPTVSNPDTPEGTQNPEPSQNPPAENNSQPQDTSTEDDMKILVAYFSLADIVPDGADAVSSATPSQGNTRTAAMEIQAQTGGDLFQITTDREYPVNHREASAIAEEEMRSDDRPALTSQVEDMAQYDVVFVGYPIWWYTSPMLIRSFLEAYDFSGKTIAPFCTTLGAGVDQSVGEIRELCPDATVLDGLTLSTGRASGMADSISAWLEELDFT